MSVLINLKEPKQVLFISALTFAYSPFATIGLVPIVIAMMIKNFIDGEEVKKVSKEVVIKFAKQFISFETLCAIFLLIIYGTYYTASDTAIADRGWTWEIAKMSFSEFIKLYIEFIACEVLFYFILLVRRNKKDPIFWVVILELIIFPFYVMTYSNDLMMRGSIPALFILCYFVIKYLSESDKVIDEDASSVLRVKCSFDHSDTYFISPILTPTFTNSSTNILAKGVTEDTSTCTRSFSDEPSN
jgi:hypothetical protein